MKRPIVVAFGVLAVGVLFLSTTAFQCSSPNITSGKMYLQQYQSNTKDTSKLNLALSMFQKEADEKPGSAEAWYWLGMVYGIKKDYLQLQQSWERSKQSGPQMQNEIKTNTLSAWGESFNDGIKKFQKAQTKNDVGLYAEAARSLKAAGLLLPDSTAAHEGFYFAAFAMRKAQPDNEAEIMKAIEQQKKLNPTVRTYEYLAEATMRKGMELKKEDKKELANAKFEEAIVILSEALVKFPEETDLNSQLLNAYVAADRTVEGKQKFKDFADKHPEDKIAQYAYGTVLLETKEYEDAVTYLDRALVLDAKMINALYNSCVGRLRWGIKLRDAESAANPEKQITSHKPIIEKALPNLKMLLELKADALQNWELAGKIYAALNMTKEAQDAYKKADELRAKK
ncbi:MAG: hypothetical protein IPP94_12880 [Ignavibacteria bacterium]|nr:hypothetical protein [Ignavibacteria bacterium]